MSPTTGIGERPTRTHRLLIADADAESRDWYGKFLKAMGCDVIAAVDGRDALVNALVHRPSLVITDTRLPVFDGYELLRLLRRDATTRSVPILVVTGETRDSELKRARDAGATSVLIRPVTPEALLREVQRLLDEKPEPPTRDHATDRRRATTVTTSPPAKPPSLTCPSCDRSLTYEQSHVGGVRNSNEQWDTFACVSCGRFEYRQRTRRLRRLSA